MKIVGFEANNGLRLGVVEGDAVIDLQAVDATVPGRPRRILAGATTAISSRSPISPKRRRPRPAARSPD